MAARKGLTFKDVFDLLRDMFTTWDDQTAAAALARLNGQDVGIDNFMVWWHDCRRAKTDIAAWRARVESLAGTPAQGRQALRDYAESMYGETYDILAETQAFIAALDALQAAIVTAVGGVDGSGFIQGQYVKLDTTGAFFRQITSTEYAPVVTAFQGIQAAVIE